MADDKLSVALVPWVRNSNLDELERRLQQALQQDAPGGSIHWRPNEVQDVYNNRMVPLATQRLIRWDNRHPDIIFRDGFYPQSDSQDDINMYAHVQHHESTIFVSTTEPYVPDRNRRPYYWRPRGIGNLYEYEIYAPGGIPVNLCFQHTYMNQHEIAFPGGIRPEFIRNARQHDAQGRVAEIWVNMNFDQRYADDLYPNYLCNRDPTIPPEWGPRDELKRSVQSSSMDFLAMEGELLENEFLCKVNFRNPKAAVIEIGAPDQAYIFSGSEYARIKLSTRPDMDDVMIQAPRKTTTNWPSLKKAKFSIVHAMLPTSNSTRDNTHHVFSNNRYAKITVVPGTWDDLLVEGPLEITRKWSSLQRAQFAWVDAVLPSPTNVDEAYFFCGHRYARINHATDSISYGPAKILDEWVALKKAGFDKVDMAILSPVGRREAYFFKDDQYVLVEVNPGAPDRLILGPRSTVDHWPSLKQTGFFSTTCSNC